MLSGHCLCWLKSKEACSEVSQNHHVLSLDLCISCRASEPKRTKNIYLHTKSGVSADSRKNAEKVRKTALSPYLLLKNEKAAQRGSFRAGFPADIRGSFARISRPKTSVRVLEVLGKQAFGADIHDPKARTSTDPTGSSKTSVRKTLG